MNFIKYISFLYGISLILGLAIYLRGFMAFKAPVEGYASWNYTEIEPGHSPGKQFPATFQRFVIILIDALRADFVLPLEDVSLPQMDYVRKLIEDNRTISFLSKAHPPTVTLPRIKALTSGDIPGFVDVVLNFDSSALRGDNLISQLKQNGKTLVFFGDDTWLRLFPDSFSRQDGTTSFFVSDYTEVDKNVTRHLDTELEANDWDGMIMHYLGLDHIGHFAGPFSTLVKPKLNEMDSIIKRVYNSILKQDAISGENTLLLVCGDHGMSDHGSHGGSSTNEINTPFIFLSSLWHQGKGLPFDSGKSVSQVDLVPTLALLLGVPIPQSSLGNIITSMFQRYSLREQLSALYINAKQLVRVFKENVPNWDKEPDYISLIHTLTAHETFISNNNHLKPSSQGLGLSIQAKYIKALKAIRERIAETLIRYDLHAMGLGIVLLWLTLFSLVLLGIQKIHTQQGNASMGILPFVAIASLAALHIVLCTNSCASPFLCDAGLLPLVAGMLIVVCAVLWCLFILAASADLKQLLVIPNYSILQLFLLLGTAVHSFTLMASSFVEEEHQTWYLLVTTLPVVLACSILKVFYGTKREYTEEVLVEGIGTAQYSAPGLESSDTEDYYLQIQKINHFHGEVFGRQRTIKKEKVQESEKVPIRLSLSADVLKGLLCLSILLLTLRVARSWNRTGDKWAHLPDVGDWLSSPEQKEVLSLVCLLSLCAICCIRWRRGATLGTSNFLLGGAVGVYLFRSANGDLIMPFLYGRGAERGVLEARVTYAFILAILANAISNYISRKAGGTKPDQKETKSATIARKRAQFFTHLQMASLVLMLLLYRPHNIPLVLVITIMDLCLRPVVLECGLNLPTWSVTLLYLWMGNANFFFQGNSNSISTVDVSAGYIGLVDYKPIAIGLLMYLSTYAGHIFWIISLLTTLSVASIEQGKHNPLLWEHMADEVTRTLLVTRALPLAIYTCLTTLQRYHLFVWTVFSPKLLYEGQLTLIIVFLAFLVQLARFMR